MGGREKTVTSLVAARPLPGALSVRGRRGRGLLGGSRSRDDASWHSHCRLVRGHRRGVPSRGKAERLGRPTLARAVGANRELETNKKKSQWAVSDDHGPAGGKGGGGDLYIKRLCYGQA